MSGHSTACRLWPMHLNEPVAIMPTSWFMVASRGRMSEGVGSWLCCWERRDAMTEAEWLEATDPEIMLPMLLEIEPSERKVRLFCCACCRRIWHLFSDDRCRNA